MTAPRGRSARRPASARPASTSSSLRIIGGRWRGRKLRFTAAQGLRPTGDRIRETLFNWLAAELPEARCADLFSGSGALGLEALSRGAAHCDFIDTNPESLAQIRHHLNALGATSQARCHACNALDLLSAGAGPWDIVFIDPPFGLQLVEPSCALLAQCGALAPGASIYVETGADEPEAALPADWLLHRDKTSGAVRYRLFHTGA
ncbi:16S rRNA (guanine(966)-N(2))-methyltransferase RsmD [Haliea sp.]|uniref:16S rRNA (guanine(966)-N(2))-methyltransferase RsmD n=1 Tax=Haliea sp. TaxID=1932666 RepID=UPI003528A248